MGISDDVLYHQQWYLQPYTMTASSQAHTAQMGKDVSSCSPGSLILGRSLG